MKIPGSTFVPAIVIAAYAMLPNALTLPRNPPIQSGHDIQSYVKIPANVQRILQRSCYDCHSYQTRWPWYARVPGVSSLLGRDIRKARTSLNLSDWNAKMAEGPEEAQASLNGICEELRTDSMPIPEYRWLHRDAPLTPAEVETVCRWTANAKSR